MGAIQQSKEFEHREVVGHVGLAKASAWELNAPGFDFRAPSQSASRALRLPPKKAIIPTLANRTFPDTPAWL